MIAGLRFRWLALGLTVLFTGGCAPAIPQQSWRHDVLLATCPTIVRNAYQERIAAVESGTHASTSDLTELGQFYHANGFTAAARAIYAELAIREPADARWPYLTALTYIEAGESEEAMSNLHQSTELDPTHALAWWHLGTFAFYRGDKTLAADAFTSALQHDPSLAHAHLGLARIHIANTAWTEATDSLHAAINADDSLSSAYNLLAQTEQALGHDGEARRITNLPASRYRYHDPVDPEVDQLHNHCFDISRLQIAADTEFTALRVDRAISLIERALKLDPDSAELALALGKMHFANDHLELGFHWLNQAVHSDPHLAEAHRTIVFEARRQGDLVTALAAVERGIAANPDTPALRHLRALCLIDQGDPDTAESDLRYTVKSDPTNATYLRTLADFYWDHNRQDAAIPFYESLRALAPLALLPRLRLASHYLNQDDLENADTCVDEALALTSDDKSLARLRVTYFVRRGHLLRKHGHYAEAAQSFESALAIDPSSLTAIESLCLVLIQTRHLAPARENLRTFIEANPTMAKPRYLLGGMLLYEGEIDQAKAQLAQAASLANATRESDLLNKIQLLRAQIVPR